MIQSEKATLLSDIAAGLSLLTSTKRPTPPTIERAVTLFRKVHVACQTIPVTPVDEFGLPQEPGTPGPEDPPIVPQPPDPPGTENPPPPPTTVTLNYTSVGDFTTVQGYRGWYYLEQDGTSMVYDATDGRWEGRSPFQLIWNQGQHPAVAGGAMRRWTAQGSGTYVITGTISDQSPGGTSGVTFSILKNGTTIYTQAMADGGSLAPSLTGSIAAGDTIDFLVTAPDGDIGKDGTLTAFNIALTVPNTGGTGSPTQTQLPFLLNGTAPQEGTLTLNMNKPSNADSCTLSVTGVNLAAAYGLLYFNGTSNTVTLWPTAPGNAGISATVDLQVPVAYVINGQNTLRFTHASGSGYTVTAVSVAFTTPTPPTPPATQTSLPFILNGSILPEDGLLTMNLTKPANVLACTVSVTGTDLAEADGTLSVNSTSNTMTIWPVNSANNGAIRTVQLDVNPAWFNNGTNALRFTHTSGDGFIISAVSVAFTQQPDPPPPDTGGWPNQPAGYTLRTDWGFSALSGSGWTDEYNGASLISVVQNQDGPVSPPHALQARFPIGHPGGNGTGAINYWYSPGTRALYVGFMLKLKSPFQNHHVGNKIMYFTDNSGSGRPYFCIVTGSGSTLGMALFGQADSSVDNRHLPGVTFAGSWNMFASTSNVVVGQWNRCEFLLRKSTTKTSQDGICQWWVNGTRVGNFTNVNTDQNLFSGPHINPVFGGTGGAKTQEDFIWYDHCRIATGN